MSEFKSFAKAIADRLATFPENTFSVSIPGDGIGDDLWQLYLASFPKGTNPIFRVRTEHDGSYDRNFIRQLGGLVYVSIDGSIRTIWDCYKDLPYPYNVVAEFLAKKVASLPIKTLFRTKESLYGHKPNTDDEGNHFTHFLYKVPSCWQAYNSTYQGKYNGAVDVIIRTVEALNTPNGFDALNQVKDLISNNAIYRGREFQGVVNYMIRFMEKVANFEGNAKMLTNYLWTLGDGNIATFKNSSIGSLVFDLAEGMELAEAVRLYETKVAPQNYRRTAALVTPSMINKAMSQVEEMGLRDSLERRHAVLGDLCISDVLWVDRSASKMLSQDPLMDSLLKGAKKSNKSRGITEGKKLLLSEFIEQILPDAEKVELLVENRLRPNFMVMTAPRHSGSPDLFRWDGSIGWNYSGNATDALTERVKAAGGNVDAPLRFSLGWANGDDMDLHLMSAPGMRYEVYFGNRNQDHATLDVDMNAGGPTNSTDPVENIYLSRLEDGVYQLKVNRYSRRSTSSQGWTVQIAVHNQVVRTITSTSNENGSIKVTIKNGQVVNVSTDAHLSVSEGGSTTPGEFWKVETEHFNEVNVITYSPNHWDEGTGNKHVFFLLKEARCPDDVRGIYNEFLKPELYEHRKVFDLIADKTKILANEDPQLAGVGVSSTRDCELTFRVLLDGRPHIFNITNKS